MRQKYVMGNWKMHGHISMVSSLLTDLCTLLPKTEQAQVVVFPPAIFMPMAQQLLQASNLAWGAQNIYRCDTGAFTGELSASMFCEYGCRYALVGHSERRHGFHEDEKFVADKFHLAKEHGMIPVLCVGETLDARESGITEAVLTQQLSEILVRDEHAFENSIIAYEPVWAIGTGKTATPEQAQEVHAFIRDFLAKYNSRTAEKTSILYGGSVNEKNAKSLFSMPDIDGGLVGGASLHALQFVEIVKCIN